MTLFIGLEAPDFNSPAILPDGSMQQDFSLKNFRGDNACVVFFYALNFAQVDPTELIAINNRFEEFQQRNCSVVAVSIDSFLSHQKWRQIPENQGGVGNLKFPLVSDYTKLIAEGYEILVDNTYACRATFVLDRSGRIRHQSMNDFPIGRNVDEIIRMVDAMDFHVNEDKMCPAGWNLGLEGIDADDDGAAQFLAKNSTQL